MISPIRIIAGVILAACLPLAAAAAAQTAEPDQFELGPGDMFGLADNARNAGDLAAAEQIYRALASNPDIEIRSEARFRLAMMLSADSGDDAAAAAAVELRRILDEKPDAARVRLELAAILARMGDTEGARRQLRQAQSAGLPSDVARMVAFYADALRSRRRYGASIEVALAPDSNINRASSSDTLTTILGDFTLSEDAQEQSGVGLALKQQAYVRLPVSEGAQVLVRGSASEMLYERSQFNDVSAALQVGPELSLGEDRLAISGVYAYRWFGADAYSETVGLSADLSHPLGDRTGLRFNLGAYEIDNLVTDAQDGQSYSIGSTLERAFSPESGGGAHISVNRQDLDDPGYALTSRAVGAFAFRDIAGSTFLLNLQYAHLEADERLFLYPKRRVDDAYTLGLSGTFRRLQFRGFAPVLRLRYEHNASTVEVYDYDRISSEIGISRAF